VTNHKAKTVFVSTELYSRGISGDTSGHGSDALQALTALRQNLASQSEYTIITLTSLNAGSAPLHERVGRPLTQLMKADLVRFRTLVPDDQWLAWKELLASLTHNASYYRVDTPQSEFIPSSQFDMDIVPIIADFLELNQVDRTTPSLHDGQPSTSSSLFGKILHNLFR
ncbi:hypothetical protein KC957_01710, partial [Candidatus Saccharibacteria bacterium]|nr:hypothetical protein [Candidatus Saccharibacteria bacterium]